MDLEQHNRRCVQLFALAVDGEGWNRRKVDSDWVQLKCTECDGGEPNERSLHLNVTTGGGECKRLNNCAWRGTVTELADHAGVVLPSIMDTKKELGLADDVQEKKVEKFVPERELVVEVEEVEEKEPWEDPHVRLMSNDILVKDFYRNRAISKSTLSMYQVGVNGDPRPMYTFPYFNEYGDYITIKNKGKTPDGKKIIFQVPRVSDLPLFGSQLLEGRERVYVTEGEEDAMALFDLLGGSENVVSIPSGAGGGMTEESSFIKMLREFGQIFVCFDADLAGRNGAEKIAKLLQSKAWIVTLPDDREECKDICDFMVQGRREDILHSIAEAEQYILSQPEGVKGIGDDSVFNNLRKMLLNDSAKGIQTHLNNLNELIGGLRAGEVTVVSAHVGSGKSAFSTNLAFALSADQNIPTYVASLECSEEDFTSRIYQQMTGKFWSERLDGLGEKVTVEELIEARDRLASIPLSFSSQERVTAAEALIRIEGAIRSRGARVVVLDHLHYLKNAIEDASATSHEQLSETMATVKEFASRNNVHVLLVAHVNRAARDKKMPSLRDLSGSASIEQIADNVLIIERSENLNFPDSGVAKMSLQKLRRGCFGGIGSRYLLFDKRRETFRDLTQEQAQQLGSFKDKTGGNQNLFGSNELPEIENEFIDVTYERIRSIEQVTEQEEDDLEAFEEF